MPKNTASRRLRQPGQSLAGATLLALLSCLTAAPLHAQDWMSGMSPWSSFGTPMSQSPLSPWSNLSTPMSQTTLSPWSSFGSPMGQSTLSPWSGYTAPTSQATLPYAYGSQFGNQWPALSGLSSPYRQQSYNAWQTPYSGQVLACPDTQLADSHQPDLTGFWRGSGGESVEVQRNHARIWGGQRQPCNCVFFLVGQRLIAYSPDSDVVRKYWYQSGGANQFTLVDESGNVMTYQRAR